MTNDLPTWIDIDPPERRPHPNPVYIGPAMWEWLATNGTDVHQYAIAPTMPVEKGTSIYITQSRAFPFYRYLPKPKRGKR